MNCRQLSAVGYPPTMAGCPPTTITELHSRARAAPLCADTLIIENTTRQRFPGNGSYVLSILRCLSNARWLPPGHNPLELLSVLCTLIMSWTVQNHMGTT